MTVHRSCLHNKFTRRPPGFLPCNLTEMWMMHFKSGYSPMAMKMPLIFQTVYGYWDTITFDCSVLNSCFEDDLAMGRSFSSTKLPDPISLLRILSLIGPQGCGSQRDTFANRVPCLHVFCDVAVYTWTESLTLLALCLILSVLWVSHPSQFNRAFCSYN